MSVYQSREKASVREKFVWQKKKKKDYCFGLFRIHSTFWQMIFVETKPWQVNKREHAHMHVQYVVNKAAKLDGNSVIYSMWY